MAMSVHRLRAPPPTRPSLGRARTLSLGLLAVPDVVQSDAIAGNSPLGRTKRAQARVRRASAEAAAAAAARGELAAAPHRS